MREPTHGQQKVLETGLVHGFNLHASVKNLSWQCCDDKCALRTGRYLTSALCPGIAIWFSTHDRAHNITVQCTAVDGSSGNATALATVGCVIVDIVDKVVKQSIAPTEVWAGR
jgi:hypothetical protein